MVVSWPSNTLTTWPRHWRSNSSAIASATERNSMVACTAETPAKRHAMDIPARPRCCASQSAAVILQRKTRKEALRRADAHRSQTLHSHATHGGRQHAAARLLPHQARVHHAQAGHLNVAAAAQSMSVLCVCLVVLWPC